MSRRGRPSVATFRNVDDGVGAVRKLAWGQGLYWASAGAWPLVHMPRFEAVAALGWATWGRPRAAGGEGER